MKRRRFSLVAAAALAIAIPATALAAPADSPFAGTWVATDTDGSAELLIVSGGPRPSVLFEDFHASTCDGVGDPATHWVSAGSGYADGDLLAAVFHKSGCGVFSIGIYVGFWEYDSGTGTLTDDADITWYRLT